jgi:nicotinate dehydrogenase subunit A
MPETAFDVNGAPATAHADPDTPLLYVLRNDLGLRGARFGCGQGLCGACTVIVDGRPVNSCDTPVWMVEGKQVRTIESLADGERLHPVQQAVLDEQAGQCGYCLSGIVMAAVALLEERPGATRAEIVEALDGHLCRCGAHGRIVRAIERARDALGETA